MLSFIFGATAGIVVGIIFGPPIWKWVKSNVEKNQNPKP